MIKTVFLHSQEETEAFASSIGAQLIGGECIELESDLGGGKTTFTRGLLNGMNSIAAVSSPTFTISKRYDAGELTVYHYDFYRLQEPGLVAEELKESLEDPMAVIVIEWAETVKEALPRVRIHIAIHKTAGNENTRKLIINVPDKLEYAIAGANV